MLTEFAGWWLSQWRSLLPRALTAQAGRDVDAVVLSTGDGTVLSAALRRRGRLAPLGTFDADPSGVAALRRALARTRASPRATVLRIPPAVLLERDVPLPLAAERDAERVLGYELDRLTPFAAADVLWSFATVARDRARGRLTVRLSVVPRAAVAATLAVLAGLGLPATSLECGDAPGPTRTIALDRPDGTRLRRARLARNVGLAACAALALAAIALPVVRQAAAGDAVEARIDQLRPQVALAEALRRKVGDAAAGADVVSAERARTGDALQALAMLTDILPDDTFLTDLSLHQGRLGLTGQSGAAARLIPVLAAEPGLRNPTFSAPVTRLDGTAIDVFTIRAEVTP